MGRKRQAVSPEPPRDYSQMNLIKTAMIEMLVSRPHAIWVHCDFPPSELSLYSSTDPCPSPVVGTIGMPTTVDPYLPCLDALRSHAFKAIQHSDPVSLGLIGVWLEGGVYSSDDHPGLLEIQQEWLGYLLGQTRPLTYKRAWNLSAPIREHPNLNRETKFACLFIKQIGNGFEERRTKDGTPIPFVPTSNPNERTLYIRDQLLRHPSALYLTHSPSSPSSPTPHSPSFLLPPPSLSQTLTKILRRFIFRALEQRQNDEEALGMLCLILSSLKGEGVGMGLKMNVAEDLEIDEDSLQAFGEEQEEVLKERTGEEGGRLREAIELLRGTEVRWDTSPPRPPIFTNPSTLLPRAPTPPEEEELVLAEGEYIVESILDERVEKGGKRYFVKWKGYPVEEGTWESHEGLEETEALDRWEREGGKPRKKRKS